MKKKLLIRRLEEKDKEAFVQAYEEFVSSGDFDFVHQYKKEMDFAELIRILNDHEKGLDLPKGYVPFTYLFGFVGEKIVGRVMLRHSLNKFLRRVGGHIGYGVVPSERGKGYASEMFRESLILANSLGLEKVLVTCSENNINSKKIIERAGGVLEHISLQEKGLPNKCHYWVISNQLQESDLI